MIPILLSSGTKDGTRLVRLPRAQGAARHTSESQPHASCDDPFYPAYSGQDGKLTSDSPNKPYTIFSGKPQGSQDALQRDASDKLDPESQLRTDVSRTSSSSTDSGTGFTKGSKLDPEKSVVLVLENMSQRMLKGMVLFTGAFDLAANALGAVLVVLGGLKVLKDGHNPTLDVATLAVGTPCLAVALILVAVFANNVIRCHQGGAQWSVRRRKLAMLNLGIVFCNAVALIFYVLPSAYTLQNECEWIAAFVIVCGYLRWTCWNITLLLLVAQVHSANAWTDHNGNLLRRNPLKDLGPSVLAQFGRSMSALLPFKCLTSTLALLLRQFLEPSSDGPQDLPIPGAVKSEGHPANLLILDAPLAVHLPKLISWSLLQIALTIQLILSLAAPPDVLARKGASCEVREWVCVYRTWQIPVNVVVNLFVFSYLTMTIRYLYVGMQHVKQLPYTSFRLGRLLMQLYAGEGHVSGLVPFFLFTIIQGFTAPRQACLDFVHGWVYLALVLKLTELSVSLSFLFMPRTPGKHHPAVQAGYQVFAWAERQIEGRRRYRQRFAPTDEGLRQEPMFCVERALKLLYCAALAYDHEEDGTAGLKEDVEEPDAAARVDAVAVPSNVAAQQTLISDALALFALTEYRLLFEPSTDTKAIVAWNNDTILVSFRGTASMKAAKLDLEAYRVNHPPVRGSKWRHTRPVVHAGFLASWHRNNFHTTLLDLIWREILQERMPEKQPHVIVTGHSLGGALATLAAFDIAKELALTQISVVTFGAPRTGNRAFSREYEDLVPDTWHVINAKDPVTHWAKFAGAYKRCGQRVLISANGDMIVRPSYLELRAHFNTAQLRTRVKDHYLASYRQVFLNILRTQLGRRGMDHGVEGCLHLAQSVDLKQLLPMADSQLTQAEAALLDRSVSAHLVPGSLRGSQKCSVP
ncbi:hypothetical protein WJX84_004447 [Apatococcus fuscideae]|uniref:Fungal lipase-type domain-containing protein n=1 Tax=Apatococcus fuscideae TaxID=2026836 RepID=A0AAW1SEM6_9CHLO